MFPPMVVISVTNVCNLKCVHCYYKDFAKLASYKPVFMDLKLYKKIIDEISLYPGVILNFSTDGEPLLHKDFILMLEYARKKNINPISVTTNGVVLYPDLSEKIVKSRLLDIINISIDAFTREGYAKVRGKCFEKVIENTRSLIKINKDHGNPVKIMVNIIDQDEVHDEVGPFKKYWQTRVDKVIIRHYYCCHGLVERSKEHFKEITRWPCFQLWNRFNVTQEGKARYCVDDWFDKSSIGDLRRQTIAKIWQSKQYSGLRELMVKNRYREIPYCDKCTEWQGMEWNYNYITAVKAVLGKRTL